MSKITFRADDELVTQLEEFDASKSEIMREALREYLDSSGSSASSVEETAAGSDGLDELVTERVDALIAERLDGTFTPRQPQDVNVNITLDSAFEEGVDTEDRPVTVESDGSRSLTDTRHARASGSESSGKTSADVDTSASGDDRKTCTQCGEALSSSHVYCPNCGEKSSHRVFCECGDELRSDWGFCPSCGRRTPAADVLEER